MRITIINGPNLNLLGTREPEVYGNQSFENYLESLSRRYPQVSIDYFQSNIEGEIIDQIQSCDQQSDGIILNAAAYTHTSVAIGDAVKAVSVDVVEVHISNTFSRESIRHQSYIAANAKGVVIGFGLAGYELALQSFLIK